MNKKISYLFLVLALALLAFGYGLWSYHNSPKKQIHGPILELAEGTILPRPQYIQSFQLIDKKNQIFSEKDLKNHWSFLFFGFTHCPMVCPTTLANLQQMYQELQRRKIASLPQVIFISVDPEKDTPQQLTSYLQSFNPNFEGVTGNKKQIDALAKQLNIVYSKVFPQGGESDYSIEHSGTILLVNPQGQLYAIFTGPHDPKKMADDFMKVASTL